LLLAEALTNLLKTMASLVSQAKESKAGILLDSAKSPTTKVLASLHLKEP